MDIQVCLFQGTFVEAFVQKISPKGLKKGLFVYPFSNLQIARWDIHLCARAFEKNNARHLKKTNIKYVNWLFLLWPMILRKQPVTTPYFPQMKSPCNACTGQVPWRPGVCLRKSKAYSAPWPVGRKSLSNASNGSCRWPVGKGCCQVRGWNRCFLTNHGTVKNWFSLSKGRWGLVFKDISPPCFTFTFLCAEHETDMPPPPRLHWTHWFPGIQSQHTRVAGDLGSARKNWVQVFVDPSCQNTYCTFTSIL